MGANPGRRPRRAAQDGPIEQTGVLRNCFERLTEWDGEDVPASGCWCSPATSPAPRQPAAPLSRRRGRCEAAASRPCQPRPVRPAHRRVSGPHRAAKRRVLDLTVDAVVQIGSGYWLRVPVGKMRTDRYIPLHPQLKDLLDDWLASRPAGLRSDYLFIDRGRRITQSRVDRAVAQVARGGGNRTRHPAPAQAYAGHPGHQPGHALEAIAALLGHRSLRMTLVYARLADRTVADEYFAVSEKVETLYNAPREAARRRRRGRDAQAPSRDAPPDARQRLLRPSRRTGLPLRVDLRVLHVLRDHHRVPAHPQAQRDDAAHKGQVGLQKVFDGLLARLSQGRPPSMINP